MADVIIIGGGAAGAMAALAASDRGRSVTVIEKNQSIGRKLRITGKGRCNVTNNCTRDEFFSNIPVNPRFLYSAYSRFSCEDTMELFESLGVPLKTERGNRVFPVSDKADDIADALKKALMKNGVNIRRGKVTDIIISEGRAAGVIADGKEFLSESVVIATGGKSYPKTGSDGDGYIFAERAGHRIIPPKPSLVPIVTEEKYASEMMGLSLRNIVLTLFDTKTGKNLYSEMGEMLFTHFGVSGPLVLSASSHIRELSRGRYKLYIDLKPALDEKKLDDRILRDFSENSNRDYINSLGKLLPAKMIPVVSKLSEIPPSKKVNQISREERKNLVTLIKKFPLTVREFRPIDEAIITSGGVDVSEIDPKTMESKLCKGLFFAGEVIDADAYTGGFNLQIAFSTGFAAGSSV